MKGGHVTHYLNSVEDLLKCYNCHFIN